MQRLKAMIADIPYEQAVHSEAVYHNVLYLLFTLLGQATYSERHVNNGRLDMVVKVPGYIYVFEFKMNQSVAKAMEQINSRAYDEPFKADGCKVLKIAVNFASDKRNIESWAVEQA